MSSSAQGGNNVAEVKPIRNEQDLTNALQRIQKLSQAESRTPEHDEREILSALVEQYQNKTGRDALPNPIAAIESHMEQNGMTPRDLIPIIGSRSKVSAVLSGNRSITMPMARALHQHLGIPAEILLQEPTTASIKSASSTDWKKFPLREMAKHMWIEGGPGLNERPEELLKDLIDRAGGPEVADVLYRKNDQSRTNAKTNPYALTAWCWQVLAQANQRNFADEYHRSADPSDLLVEVARLSPAIDGPKRAVAFLAEHGIPVETVHHLNRTHLDGAALQLKDGRPVIGLTLRYDRLDNFWFTLLHELAHVALHMDDPDRTYVDDLMLTDVGDETEKAADALAQDSLIPPAEWAASEVNVNPSPMAVIALAQQIGVHPAIVAGRARREYRNFRLLSQFVGTGTVQKQFGF
jgi:HTH-type transcriptional regulator/antitoxin HigA